MAVVSLKDIARDLDVSVSLVSKVVNGRLSTTKVRPHIQEAILKRAAELGFRPNASASVLRHGRHNAIGVFIHNLGMSGSGLIEEFQLGLVNEAVYHQQRLLLSFFETRDEFEHIANTSHLGSVDGLIIAGIPHPELAPTLIRIHKGGLPIVTVLHSRLSPRFSNVGISNVKAARLATQHLIERGSRKIAHILTDEGRYKGYLAALNANHCPVLQQRVFDAAHPVDYSHIAGKLAIQSFLANHVDFDGLVTQSDQQAAGALNALLDAGLRVPQDVRVIGIDNAPFCELTRVPLSSVSQNLRQMGHLAIRNLMEAIEGRPVPKTTVEPSLVARDSTR